MPVSEQSFERPKISNEPISVLVPAYQQAAAIHGIVDAWLRALKKLERPFEIIVIDDGSTDSTGEHVHSIAVRDDRVKLLRHDVRQGFGASLRTGLAVAQYPLVLYTACDYPYQPADVRKLLEAIDAADLVSGCRTDPPPGWMQSLGQVYRLTVRVLFGLPLEPRPGWYGWSAWRRSLIDRWIYGVRLHDVQCAFKLLRKSVLDRIPIQSDGMAVHLEIVAKANFMNCLMAEVPISRTGGAFKGAPEPPLRGDAADRRRLFRRPEFARKVDPARSSAVE